LQYVVIVRQIFDVTNVVSATVLVAPGMISRLKRCSSDPSRYIRLRARASSHYEGQREVELMRVAGWGLRLKFGSRRFVWIAEKSWPVRDWALAAYQQDYRPPMNRDKHGSETLRGCSRSGECVRDGLGHLRRRIRLLQESIHAVAEFFQEFPLVIPA